jgi:hypothetical protein
MDWFWMLNVVVKLVLKLVWFRVDLGASSPCWSPLLASIKVLRSAYSSVC